MDNQLLFSNFVAELDEVQSTLLAATTDLTSPLGDLVRAQIRRSQPPICGAVVLAVTQPAGVNRGSSTAEAPIDAGELHNKRILLAAALEMLHVALNVHRLLVNAALRERQSAGEASLDPSFIGSTILAGDYCFSRAAQMAARTDHARVVAVFALALQTVSEGLLREQFAQENDETTPPTYKAGGDSFARGESDNRYDETRQLLESGAHAAALLMNLPESQQQQAIALSNELATYWALGKRQTNTGDLEIFSSRNEKLPQGWRALYLWLNSQRANGEVPTITPGRI